MTKKKWNELKKKGFDSVLSERAFDRTIDQSLEYSSLNRNTKNSSIGYSKGFETWVGDIRDADSTSRDPKNRRLLNSLSTNRKKKAPKSKQKLARENQSNTDESNFESNVLYVKTNGNLETAAEDTAISNNNDKPAAKSDKQEDESNADSNLVNINEIQIKDGSIGTKKPKAIDIKTERKAIGNYHTVGSKDFPQPSFRGRYDLPKIDGSSNISIREKSRTNKVAKSNFIVFIVRKSQKNPREKY